MKNVLLSLLFYLPFVFNASADALSGGNIQSILNANKGKLVTIKMQSGGEYTGKIVSVNTEIVQLSNLVGMEFYDTAASIQSVESIVIRTKK